MEIFENRIEAGRRLAEVLSNFAGADDVYILALPRGGVPVAKEVSFALNLPMDIIIVRKIGLPHNKELAMGAISSGGVRVLNEDVLRMYHVSPQTIEAVVREESLELQRREKLYRGDRPFPDLYSKRVILIDDGIATGATLRSAIAALRMKGVKHIIVATPVATEHTLNEFREICDEVYCVLTPINFYAIGQFYQDFSQTTDAEVIDLLKN